MKTFDELIANKSWQLRVPVYEADGTTPRAISGATLNAWLRVGGVLLEADTTVAGGDGVSVEATWNEGRIPAGTGEGEVSVRYAANDHQGVKFGLMVARAVVPVA